MTRSEYLTEVRLGKVLVDLYGECAVKPQANLPAYRRLRFDYLVDLGSASFYAEFDGYPHFTSHVVQLNDLIKDELAPFPVIRIPYFVQLDTQVTKHYFKASRSFSSYPHGFIDSKAVVPFDFNPEGLVRYERVLLSLPIRVQAAIQKSLIKYSETTLSTYAARLK